MDGQTTADVYKIYNQKNKQTNKKFTQIQRVLQVLQTQNQRLAEAKTTLENKSADIQRRQQELRGSQQQVRQDITTLIHRITTAGGARREQLMHNAELAPLPLEGQLQQRKEEVDESRWLVSANHQLVSDSLLCAGDVNLLRVSGSLAARAARLAADVSTPADLPVLQKAVLRVDQYDVLRIEELLRDLGSVELISPDSEKQVRQTDGVMQMHTLKQVAQ